MQSLTRTQSEVLITGCNDVAGLRDVFLSFSTCRQLCIYVAGGWEVAFICKECLMITSWELHRQNLQLGIVFLWILNEKKYVPPFAVKHEWADEMVNYTFLEIITNIKEMSGGYHHKHLFANTATRCHREVLHPFSSTTVDNAALPQYQSLVTFIILYRRENYTSSKERHKLTSILTAFI